MIGGRCYDLENRTFTVGGIQTYVKCLGEVVEELGLQTIMYQTYTVDGEADLGRVKIKQFKVSPTIKDRQRVKFALKKCLSDFNTQEDILIFITDSRIVKNTVPKSIGIQHGICWDIPRHEDKPTLFNSLYTFNRSRQAFLILERIRRVKTVVCVDYNFPNWYRAVGAYEAVNLKVIPNFADIAPVFDKPKEKINIIFARRFEIYRGTRIFANAVSRILKEHSNIYVTVAGSGPDEKYLKDTLFCFGEHVLFTKYSSEKSLQIHADKHIAVVPTIGSEGTSLSLLEAMSAQCAVVCSNVGGMTNIVIDGYNGLLISPNENELYEAIARLVTEKSLRDQLSANAYKTVKEGFSYDKWKSSWKKVLKCIMAD